MLEAGGNAVDAAIATAFTQGVVNPLMCGIGGTGRMLVYEAASQKTTLVDFGTLAGSKATPDTHLDVEEHVFSNRYRAKNWENYIGYKAVAIPSFVRGAWDGHQRFGALPWAQLLEPAIGLATDGFVVDKYTFSFWDPERERLSDSPPPLMKLNATAESARIYLKNEDVYRVGDVLVQTDYADSLRRIAAEGADTFYKGDMARQIAEDFERHGGLVTLEDLANCTTQFEEPTRGRYKTYDVHTEGCPSMGSLEIEALQMLDHIDLVSLGWRTARYYNILALVFQTIYQDRSLYNGDRLCCVNALVDPVPPGVLRNAQVMR